MKALTEIERCIVCGEKASDPCRSRLTGRVLSIKHDATVYPASIPPEVESVFERLERAKDANDRGETPPPAEKPKPSKGAGPYWWQDD